jgi:hypothetical protein
MSQHPTLTATYGDTVPRLDVNGAQVASRAHAGTIVNTLSPLRIGGTSVWGNTFTGASTRSGATTVP